MSTEPMIHVGIVRAPSVVVNFSRPFSCISNKGVKSNYKGECTFSLRNGLIMCDGQDVSGLVFEPSSESALFSIQDVQIGIGFHWDKRERQTFAGTLTFVVDGDALWAVNVIGVESYLRSVISSEMSATSDFELLKAHAVTSRSWLMAQVWGKKKYAGLQKHESADEVITWRDREDHLLFDVCADDHCQRYQGVSRVSSPNVDKAIAETRGLILTYEGEVCDARFSKCCGGVSERFETCWGDKEYPYLQSIHDALIPSTLQSESLATEAGARKWVTSRPEAFCNTSDANVLSQVLNDYDQSTRDFFRWTVELSADDIRALLHTKGGYDIGEILDLIPLQRGPSGRIYKLKIVGSEKSITVGKELEIRRLLSPSHLYSSAFVVDKSADGRKFTLSGAGWGHGVGLCQIGAAMMAHQGFSFRSILYHYFRRAIIEKRWE